MNQQQSSENMLAARASLAKITKTLEEAKQKQSKPAHNLQVATDTLYRYLNQAIPDMDDDAETYAELQAVLSNIIECAANEALHIIKQKLP